MFPSYKEMAHGQTDLKMDPIFLFLDDLMIFYLAFGTFSWCHLGETGLSPEEGWGREGVTSIELKGCSSIKTGFPQALENRENEYQFGDVSRITKVKSHPV